MPVNKGASEDGFMRKDALVLAAALVSLSVMSGRSGAN
jgi:hypothetical protein